MTANGELHIRVELAEDDQEGGATSQSEVL